ncbi:MAG: DUF3866 family protein [Bacillota bacterium]
MVGAGWIWGIVLAIEIVSHHMARLEVAGWGSERRFEAILYRGLFPDPTPGQLVLANTTGLDLELGTGGSAYVAAVFPMERVRAGPPGHIIKLRYSPSQLKCLAVEEPASPHHELLRGVRGVGGLPVVACGLHSQLAAVCAGAHWAWRGRGCPRPLRVAYVMTDGGALPVALSESVAALRRTGAIRAVITTGHAFGGDYEAVNLYSALASARWVVDADLAVVAMGPGIVGTGTVLGTTGLEVGQTINAAHSLGGRPIVPPRIGCSDARRRHRGLSHHTLTALTLVALAPAEVVLPDPLTAVDAAQLRQLQEAGHRLIWRQVDNCLDLCREWKVELKTMGRGFDQEPELFRAAAAAGIHAAELAAEYFHQLGEEG